MNKPEIFMKLSRGEKVAILSPSNGLPGIFPWVQDLGLTRLRDDFGLIPVEYPTTREMGSSLQDRARDIQDAFSDKTIKAVFASIGGNDQIQLIKYLDPKIFLDNPKPFFGFSDNTHLHIFLSSLGIPSFYGGSIMTQLAFQGGMTKETISSLNASLFTHETLTFGGAKEYNEIGLSWADETSLSKKRIFEPNEGFVWDGKAEAKGELWGGCIESLVAQSTVGAYLPDASFLEGKILFLESAENIPPHWLVRYLLIGFGERGWFDKIHGVMIGRPKAWDFSAQNSIEWRRDYREKQRETIISTVRKFNTTIPIVQNVDFGHTDPQIVLPIGRIASLSPANNSITLNYR